MKTTGSSLWKWCAGLSLALGLCLAAPQAQADVYLGRDGGLEGAATVDDTVQTAAQAGKWTKNNATQNIAEETTVVRSGGKSIRLVNSATTARRTWTPLLTFGSKTTAVTIQYYRLITNSTSYQTNQVGVLRATESLQGAYNAPASINTWEKKTYSPASATFTSIAGVIMHRAATSGAGSMFVDDLCIYDGSADTTAPNSAGAVTLTTNSTTELALSWDAASGGVDSGGYLVVRYASEPAAGDDPNVNGIYATNNAVAGSVAGTVVYQGDGTTYTDSGLTTDQTYYYKVYSYDKAYNYAAESTASGTPAGESTAAPSVATVAAGSVAATTATANGDVTDDGGDTVTERGVCYKTSAGVAITDNKTAAAAGGEGAYSVDLSSLSVNQIYYFKAYASNSIGETLAANELNFTTLANVPSAPTVDNPTATTLDVAVNANGNPAATEFAIQRTSDSQYLQAGGSFGASEDWQTAAEWDTTTATGLASETEYFFQVKARNGASVETAFGSTASGTTAAAPTGIHINPMSAGTPMATYYLGDVMGEYFVNFEIGQTWWNYAQLGLGTSAEGTGYNWGEATWYQDGEGNNKRVRRNLSGYQFTAAANHYVICQAKAYSGDDYTSKSGNGWGNLLAYPPADLASAYFAVNAISNATDPSATADQSSQINLFWSQNAQSHDVMVVRKLAAASWTEPTQGTSYSASDTLGAGTVIYNGGSEVFYDTGLEASTTYAYKFYSVNHDYYSAGVTAEETTLACEPDAPTGVIASETNETSFTAAWTASDRATGYRLDVSTTEFGEAAVNLMVNAGFETGDSTGWDKFETEYSVASTDPQEGTYHAAITATATRDLTQNVAITGDGTTEYEISYWYKGTGNARIWAAWTSGGQVSGDSLQPGSYNPPAAEWTKMTYTVVPQSGENVLFYEIRSYNGASMQFDNFFVGIPGAEPPVYVAGYEDLAVAGTSQLVEGLDDNTTYYFRVRAEGEGGCPGENSETASVTTLEEEVILPQARNTNGGSPEAPAAITLGDSGLTFGFDSWGTLDSNWGAARLWLRHANADLAGGTASDWTAFTDAEHKTVDSGTFDQVGTWYWGLQMDYGAEYGTAFWYKATSADWADMATTGDGATLTVTVGAISDPTEQQVTAEDVDQIDLSFIKNGQDNNVMVVRKLASASWTEPTQGTAYSVNDTFGAGTVIYVGLGPTASATGLAEDTTYDFKFYSVNNDYYSAGVTAQGTTDRCAPDAPTGLDAVEDYTSFVASWEAATGATGYRLDVSTEADFQSSGNGELIISEVADPLDVANAKFVELYNGTGAAIDFGTATWYLARQANGGSWANTQLTGTIPVGGTYVVAYNQTSYETAFGEAADQYSGNISGNGNDGYFLVQGGGYSTGTVVDAYGVINQDGTGQAWEYLDKNAVRNADVAEPNATWTASEWTIPGTTVNTADMDPDAHTCTGDTAPSFVAGYSNLAVAGTSQLVAGLDENATYYFRVRAEGEGGCPSADSTTASATTLEHLRTVLSSSDVNVREAGEGRFFVRLNKNPGGNVVVAVSRSAGDSSLAVQSGAALTFKPSNWSAWQAVTLAQAADGNAADEEATFLVSAAGVEDRSVAATALDEDVGDNLALSGTTISGTRAYQPALAIDGVHASNANYGYTKWTAAPKGTLTLDLQGQATLSRMRLLNWDWDARAHLYTIESSLNGTDWTTLADASTGTHRGWEDWEVSGTARYLRFTGVSNSANQYVCIAEWEVYGTRDTSGLPQPELSTTNANVRENGEGRFYVRLDRAPSANTAVTVARIDGDADLAITSGATLTFKPSNWSAWQAVTLAAADDEDAAGGTATFEVSIPGWAPQTATATATELDDDIGDNLALASSGTTISGTAYQPALAIDGVHASNANYGYTKWTAAPKGTMTLDLKATTTLSRMRLLNWDWDARAHLYTIESSLNGTDWTSLADASTGTHRGWEDWEVSGTARYLRFTGVSNSANQYVCIAEWEVYGTRDISGLPQPEISTANANVRENGEGRFYVRLDQAPSANTAVTVARIDGDADLAITSGATLTFKPSNWSAWQAVTLAAADDEDAAGGTATFEVSIPGWAPQTATATATELDDDIGDNLALASGGATISGSAEAYQPEQAIDGVHTSNLNYGYTKWSAVPPGTLTLDLQAETAVSRIRLLNWDWDARVHRYGIESSTDGTTWSTVVDASTGEHRGWEDWTVDGTARYLRFTGVSNSANRYVCIAELEVYGEPAPLGMPRAFAQGTSVEADSIPVSVLTSDGAEDETGWDAVDGDPETAWVGQKAGGGYLVIEYAPALTLKALAVEVTEESLADAQILYSQDAQDWQPLPEDLENNPVSLNFLWVVFPDDGSEAVPEVLEIWPNP